MPVPPSSSTGPTGGESAEDVDHEDPLDSDLYAHLAERALAQHPELIPSAKALRGKGSLTKVVQSIQDLTKLERRAVNVGAHMSDPNFPSLLAGDEYGSHIGFKGRDKSLTSGAMHERRWTPRQADAEGTEIVPESLQRLLRPDATGGPDSEERRLKREFDSVIWRLRGSSARVPEKTI